MRRSSLSRAGSAVGGIGSIRLLPRLGAVFFFLALAFGLCGTGKLNSHQQWYVLPVPQATYAGNQADITPFARLALYLNKALGRISCGHFKEKRNAVLQKGARLCSRSLWVGEYPRRCSMPTYVILSKISPDAFQDPKEFRKLASDVSSRIRKQCPGVTWKQSFATLGRFDVVDIVESRDPEQVARAALLIRCYGHASTETLPATEWKDFLEEL